MSASSRLRSMIPCLDPRPRTAPPRPARRARVQVERLDGRLLLAAGALDTTFGPPGGGGRVTSDAAQFGEAVTTQGDGKIVVAGNINNAGTSSDFVLTRLYADGIPDVAFGDGGRVVLDFYGDFDFAHAVAVQPDGKILVAGYAFTPDTDGNPETYENTEDFALARFHADGALDTAFGVGGKVSVNMSTVASLGTETARAILLQGDGRIVVGGDAMGGSGPDFALARFHANGTLDTSFGVGGKVITNFNGSSVESLRGLALQADGKIVAVGSTSTFKTSYDFGVARYNANGTLDTSFGVGGKVSTDFAAKGGKTPAIDESNGLVIQPDGRIVVVGSTRRETTADSGFALVRYSTNGTLDTSFGTGGKVITDFGGGWESASSVAQQVVGGQTRIVAAGSVGPLGQTDFAVARYNANGTLDTSFGPNRTGKVVTAFFPQQGTIPVIAIQADGKFLAVGSTYDGTRYKLALARYLGA